MKNNLRILMATSVLALAALACQAVMGGGSTEVPPTEVVTENTPEPLDTEEPLATSSSPTDETTSDDNVLLDDDFREGRSNWATGTDENSSVEYKDDALNVQVFTGNYIVWTFPNDTQYDKIHMEVTVTNNGSDADAA